MRPAPGLGLTFLARRARSSWLLLACVAVTVLLTTGLAAVLWTFAARVIPPGAQSILAAPQGRIMSFTGPVDAAQGAADSRLIRATLHRAWPGIGVQTESALWADPVQLSTSGSGVYTTQVQVASLNGLSAHATLTAGQWPALPGRSGPLPVALPAAAASRLRVTVGSVLTGPPPSGGAPVSLRVTGLFRPRDPASLYWRVDLVSSSGITVQHFSISTPGGSTPATTVSYGPAVVKPAAFGGALAATEGTWTALPRAQAMSRANLSAIAANTAAAVSQLSVALPEGLKVTSNLPPLLAGIGSTIVLARSLFTIAALQLLLVAGAGLVLAARLLASLREEESALLGARGATRQQVVRPVLAEAVVVGAVAGLAGVLAGTRLTGVIAGLTSLRLDNDHGIPPLAWLSALAMLVLCIAVMAWPALHVLTPDAARHRRGRQARVAGIAWAGGDLALVALAAVAVWELRGYSVVAHPASGSLGIDPVVAIAPALALAGLALIPLRGLPLLARLADKTTDRGRRLAAAMASWQIARRPIRQAGPALLVVVATATATLALAGYASWRQSAADQATFAVGSDVRVDSAAPVPLGEAGAIARAPGVTAATAASVASTGSGDQLIALQASTAAQAVLVRSDLSPLPLSTLWQHITPRTLAGLPLPGRPERLEMLASLSATANTSAAQVRALGPFAVTVWIQDASGAVYQIPAAGNLAADGRPHALVITLAGTQQASYPLRLLGLTMSFCAAPVRSGQPEVGPGGQLYRRLLRGGRDGQRPVRPAIPRSSRPGGPGGHGSSRSVPTGPASASGQSSPANGAPPVAQGWHRAAGGAEQLTFTAGHDPSAQVMNSVGISTAVGQVAITPTPPPSQAIPVIATSGYLTARRLSTGSFTTVSVGGYPFTVQVVASVAHFPTVFGPNRALIADLAQLNDMLVSNQVPPLPVTRWWLSTGNGVVPLLPAALRLSVTNRAAREAALLSNPLLKAPRQAMLAIGAAAVLLGVLGFSVSVAASLRSRRTQSAVFAALGVGKNAQAGQLCLEQGAISLPAAAAGLLAGTGLAELIMPAITLTAGAAVPVPWALAIVPLGPAAALALVTAAVPVAAAALSILRRPDPAAQLRAEAR